MDQQTKNSWWNKIKPWACAAGYVYTPIVLSCVDGGIGMPFFTTGYTLARVFKTVMYGGGLHEIPIFFWNFAVLDSLTKALKDAEQITKS